MTSSSLDGNTETVNLYASGNSSCVRCNKTNGSSDSGYSDSSNNSDSNSNTRSGVN